MWCHLLLLSPVVGLVLFLFLPPLIAAPLYAAIALGSLVLFIKLWKSMTLRPTTGTEALVGSPAWTATDIERQGLVQCRGELWTAFSSYRISKGERVHILAFEGLRVLVEKD